MVVRVREAKGSSSQAALLAARALDEVDANVAVIDHDGFILLTNRPWRDFAANNRLSDGSLPRHVDVGTNYFDICQHAEGPSSENARAISEGIRSVLDGRKKLFIHEYPCHSPTMRRWFRMRVKPVRYSKPRQAVIVHIDVTDKCLAELETAVRQSELTAALLRIEQMAGSLRSSVVAEQATYFQTSQFAEAKMLTVPITARAFDKRLKSLSRREIDIMNGILRGERNAAMANRLRLSQKSVSTYRARVFEKLKVASNAELVAMMSVMTHLDAILESKETVSSGIP